MGFLLGLLAALIGNAAAVKWVAGRFLFRVGRIRLLLLAISPLAGMLCSISVLYLVDKYAPDSFFEESGDAYKVMGTNIVFFVAFVIAMFCMCILDGVLTGREGIAFQSAVRSKRFDQLIIGWIVVVPANAILFFYWVMFHYSVQFPTTVDFDG